MKDNIIKTAGLIWQSLGKNGEANLSKLAGLIGEKDVTTYQALGWLAREDKINYVTKGKNIFVSLVQSEVDIYNSVSKYIEFPTGNSKASQNRIKGQLV